MNAVVDLLGRQSRAALLAGVGAAIVAITVLSYVGGPELGLPVLYVLPVAVAAWFGSLSSALLSSLLATLLWLALERQHGAGPADIAVWNGLIRWGSLSVLSWLLAAMGAALHEARSDYQTGVANRQAFYDAVLAESRRAQRYASAFTVLDLEVDGLRTVGERFGHSVADALVRSVASTLRARMRVTDLIAHVETDRFAVLLPETDAEAAQGVLRKLEGVLAGIAEKEPWAPGFSIGAVTFRTAPESAESALNRVSDLLSVARRNRSAASRVQSLAESIPADRPASDVARAV